MMAFVGAVSTYSVQFPSHLFGFFFLFFFELLVGRVILCKPLILKKVKKVRVYLLKTFQQRANSRSFENRTQQTTKKKKRNIILQWQNKVTR